MLHFNKRHSTKTKIIGYSGERISPNHTEKKNFVWVLRSVRGRENRQNLHAFSKISTRK